MNTAEVFLMLFIGYLIVEEFLDFMIPGRWEKRAYKDSMKDLERRLKKRVREE